ncbi:uncharacterized protein LOC133873189 [Alnus glutinosa]|uniref:uncharacterized protein LOC133873189 n=1 Tax=Alnus glutinosa TaxID=3517 RepID=UPI002D76B7F8|nr:uncharacterized protein LOC133873189 [Alnus glutinosa]
MTARRLWIFKNWRNLYEKVQKEGGPGKLEVEMSLKEELDNLLEAEDLKWRQRAKEDWLKAENFKDVDCCTRTITPKVTPQMNQNLIAPVSIEEVQLALNQMAPLKAPGPDGFPAFFFQQNWDVLHQECFISGRLITDNIIAAYETMHTMQTRMWSKTGYMGIKLDMSKAFDRVEWSFLEAVMHKLGFADAWVGLIMNCVKSVSYSVVVNGNVVENIILSRGIR